MTPRMRETFAWLRANGFMVANPHVPQTVATRDEKKGPTAMRKFTLTEKTEMSRAFDAGNYANAYETTDLQTALKRSRYTAPHTRAAFVLGFYGSYSLDEIGNREIFDVAYWSDAGQYIVNEARYCDSRDNDFATETF